MMTLAHVSAGRTSCIRQDRIWRVLAAVLLVHAGLAWLLSLGLLSSAPPSKEVERVIIASVVLEAPSPPAVVLKPVEPKSQPRPQARPPKPVATPAKPIPVPTLAAPVEKPPIVATPAPVVAAAPMAAPAPVVVTAPVVAAAPVAVAAPVVPAAPSVAAVPVPAPSPVATPAVAAQPRARTSSSDSPVVLPSSDADYFNNPAPAYPRMSRRLGEQGTVVLRVLINAEGAAEKAEIRTSSGYSRLDEAAVETVKRWRYVPGKRAGIPEAMWFNLPVRFVLD